jgi:light-regulated signal transduction histidine kinase (bacteriophytochrome)
VKVPRPLPAVRADRVRVGEIFYNLIVNAMKYNDKADKWIEIGWRENPAGPPVFYVRDNGIGIPEKHHDSVFRIFKRLHGRDKYGGGRQHIVQIERSKVAARPEHDDRGDRKDAGRVAQPPRRPRGNDAGPFQVSGKR